MSTTCCHNHPETPATDLCAGCAESFCRNCLVKMNGRTYCASCKVLALEGRELVVEGLMSPCKDATQAFWLGWASLVCFGIFMGPFAISKAVGAKQQISENPQLTGWGKANAAILLGVIGILATLLGAVSRFNR